MSRLLNINLTIFNLGISKTGTTSFHKLMKELNVTSWHDITISEHTKDELKKEFLLMDCYTGGLTHRYKDIFEVYPDAKYILTIRDKFGWLKSARKLWQVPNEDENFAGFRKSIFGTTKVWELSDLELLNSYDKINKEIIDFFKDKENFMVLNIVDAKFKDKVMKELVEFLNIELISDLEFPHFIKIRMN